MASTYQTPAVQPQSVVVTAWKEFTPMPIDHGACLAGMWSGGRGGQCLSGKLPEKDLCKGSLNEITGDAGLRYSLITGAIPDEALMKFQKKKHQHKDVEHVA